jgi:hypothetical protein
VTITEVVSVYNSRSVSATVAPACSFKMEDGTLHVSRVTACYRKANNEPWEFGLVAAVRAR